MHIRIAAIGRLKSGPLRSLFEDYRSRSQWPIAVYEYEERRKLPEAQLKIRESALLQGALPPGGSWQKIVLDERGKMLDSQKFADWLRMQADQAISGCIFFIGGAAGHDAPFIASADLVLSLSPMTWPHMLCRVMLVEQLYRAQQILTGHPYHRA